jgi:hypothetical protein
VFGGAQFDYTSPNPAYGRGLFFNGSSDFIHVDGWDFGPDFTLGVWFFTESFSDLFSITKPDDGTPIFRTYKFADDKLVWEILTAKSPTWPIKVITPTIPSSVTISGVQYPFSLTNQWNFLTFTTTKDITSEGSYLS